MPFNFFNKLEADDIFISYSREDGEAYLDGLSDALTKLEFSCFDDRQGTDAGRLPPQTLFRKIRNCRTLVVLATPGAIRKSKYLAQEVSQFAAANGTTRILAVSFDKGNGELDDWSSAEWNNLLEGKSRARESAECLDTGKPSAAVVSRIEKKSDYLKSKDRLRKYRNQALAGLLTLVVATIAAAGVAWYQLRRAAAATTTANAAAEKAEAQELIAVNKTAEADKATKRATKAEETATAAEKVAAEKTRLAEDATKKAEQQAQIARKAEGRANAAIARADKEELKARSTLARNYYNQAQAEAASDPGSALLWAQRAVETAPPGDDRLGVYMLRVLHLTRRAPRAVVNAPLLVAFSPLQDRVITISGHEELAVWDIKTGKRLPDPLSSRNTISFATNISSPTFSPDGKWIAALTWEKPTEEGKLRNDLRLHVWSALSGEHHFNHYDPRFESIERNAELRFAPDSSAVMLSRPSLRAQELLIWDLPSGAELRPIRTDEQLINTKDGISEFPMSRNPKHNRLITFTHQKSESDAAGVNQSTIESAQQPPKTKIEVKDIRSGDVLLALPAAIIFDFIDFTDDAERVITVMREEGSEERTLRIWDLKTKEPSPAVPFDEFQIVGMNRDGSLLLVSNSDNSEVHVWDVEARTVKPLIDLPRTWSRLNAYFSDDEKYVITRAVGIGDEAGEVSVWEIGTGLRIQPPMKLTSAWLSNLSLSEMTVGQLEANGVISVRSLHQTGERNALSTDRLLVAQDHKFVRAFLHPTQQTVLTLDQEKTEPTEAPMTLRLWDLTTGRPLWEPAGITTNFVRDVSFHPTQNLMVTLALEEDPPVPTGIFGDDESQAPKVVARVREMSTGRTITGFNPPRGDFDYVAFSRDGARLTTAESTDRSPWKVRLWDAKTGIEVPSEPAEFETLKSGRFYALTRYAEFMLILNLRDTEYSDYRELTVRSTEAGARQTRPLRFVRHADAALAATILKQALKLTLPSDEEVIAEFDHGISISLKASPRGATIVNRGTGKQFIAPPDSKEGFQRLEFNPQSGLVLTSRVNEGLMRLWEGTTGAPVSETMWHEGDVHAFAFNTAGDSVLTVTENGRVRVWYLGQLATATPPWMREMGEALSGMRIVSDVEVQRLSVEDHARIRRRYLLKLRDAADGGDRDAQFVLHNWQRLGGSASQR